MLNRVRLDLSMHSFKFTALEFDIVNDTVTEYDIIGTQYSKEKQMIVYINRLKLSVHNDDKYRVDFYFSEENELQAIADTRRYTNVCSKES